MAIIAAPEHRVTAVAAAGRARQLYDERLATLPGVLRLSSTLVMKSVVDARPLPL